VQRNVRGLMPLSALPRPDRLGSASRSSGSTLSDSSRSILVAQPVVSPSRPTNPARRTWRRTVSGKRSA
jgi:hypothetical protein